MYTIEKRFTKNAILHYSRYLSMILQDSVNEVDQTTAFLRRKFSADRQR